jgi:putative FmdB family regulatory protein
MPIYAYRCSSCQHAQDILRKISDPPLLTCTACQQDTFVKQVTSAGFALKGTGWYVTDFRDNGGGKKDAPTTSVPSLANVASHGAAAPAAEKNTATNTNTSTTTTTTTTTTAKATTASSTSTTTSNS